ncbi:MAG: hypothetical protein ACM3SP_26405 [Chloroflexota bacterium]|jgi:hypothetical protein
MTTQAIAAATLNPKRMRYASVLRCVGQSLEATQLKAVEIKTHGDDLVVQAWNRGTSMAMDYEKHYTLEDLRRLDEAGRAKRRPFFDPPDLLSLPQIFRLAGNYVDRLHGRLLRVSWQDQSDKIQSITVQWEPIHAGADPHEFLPTTVEELCIHIYKQRKKINLATERQSHRPFVSVGRAS